jgi:hypothetical protein
MAKFISTFGPKYDFHWARYSTFACNFADKDFLYHLTLVPLTYFGDMFTGMKLATCVYAIFLLLVFYFCLRRYSSPIFIPYLLVAFIISSAFLHALCRARPMVPVMALTLLFIHHQIKKNFSVLFILALIYALTHVSSPYLLLFSVIAESVRLLSDREFYWKNVCATGLGVIVGFLVHPNFPNNLMVFYINGIKVPVFALKWGIELGAEFFPISTRDLAFQYPFIIIGLIVLIVCASARTAGAKTSTRIWMAVACFFFIFSFFSQRYLIHLYPLFLVSVGAYMADTVRPEIFLNKLKSAILILVAALIAGFFSVSTFKDFRKLSISENIIARHYIAAANWMSKNLPKTELVFHANWSDSQYFIGLNPQNDYYVTLDPTYMFFWNKAKYSLYRDLAFAGTSDPYRVLSDDFKTRFGYASKVYFGNFIRQIRNDSRFSVLAEDDLGLIFMLKDVD